MDTGGGFSNFTFLHGCKAFPDPSVCVEDCLIAVGNKVSALNIKSASHMNKVMVAESVKSGLMEYFPVLLSSNPSKKVVLSNVPPFIKNETLTGILAR